MANAVDYRTVKGPDKAALFMLALGEEHSAKLWSMLEDEEIKELSQTMANLGSVSSEVIEKLFLEFVNNFSTTGAVNGTFETTERLLMKGLPPDRVAQIMEEIRGPAGRTMWDKLANVNEQILASYLKNEYPQTVAVVLSKIRTDHAARVLSCLPEEFSMEVIMRMLRIETVQKEVLDKVEATLRTEFMSNLARTTRRDSHEMMAEIFTSLDRVAEQRFLNALEERSRDAAEKIRALMFTFEDLQKLDPNGVQTLLKSIERQDLGVALKGASETLRDLFFSNMSERAAKLLREEMESMGPLRMKDVNDAQASMVRKAKELADQGAIILAIKASGDDQLVY